MPANEFYIVIRGEKKLAAELKVLFDRFILLGDKAGVKKFQLFLASPFLVSDKKRASLFSLLYKRYQNGARLMQGAALIRSVLKHEDQERGFKQLRSMVKQLSADVMRFHALCYLEGKPVEMDRLIVRALSPEVRPSIYRNAIKKYSASAAALPFGVEGAVQRWEAAFLGHFSFSAPKWDGKGTTLPEIAQVTRHMTELLELAYRAEVTNRYGILEEDEVRTVPSPLSKLFTSFLQLYEQDYYDPEGYLAAKTELLAIAATLDDVQCYTVITFFNNYLNRHHRRGVEAAEYEILYWTRWQLRPNMYASVRCLSRVWLLNQIGNACKLKEFDIAEKVINVHSGRIDPEERQLVIAHAESIILFCQAAYQKAFNKITLTINDRKLTNYADGLSLKSIRLMCALKLFADDPVRWMDDYTLALKDYEGFIKRAEGKLGKKRIAFFRRLLVIIRKCRSALTRHGGLATIQEELLVLINGKEELPGRSWLLEFLGEYTRKPAPVTARKAPPNLK